MRRLNPGYKLLSLIIASLLLSVTFHTRLNLLVCGTSLLAAYLTPGGLTEKRLSLTLIPFVLTAAGLFTAGLFFSSGGQEGVEVSALGQRTLYATNWVTAAQLSSRVFGLRRFGASVRVYHQFYGFGHELDAAIPSAAEICLRYFGGLSLLPCCPGRI